MQTKWFQHLKTQAEQEEFKKVVLNSNLVLDRLRDLCYNTIKNGEKSSLTDYDSPSWAYKQADQLGYNRAYQEIITLLDLDQR